MLMMLTHHFCNTVKGQLTQKLEIKMIIGLYRPNNLTRFRSSSTMRIVSFKSSCSTTIGILVCSRQQSTSASHRLERPRHPNTILICYASSKMTTQCSLRISRSEADSHNSETEANCILSLTLSSMSINTSLKINRDRRSSPETRNSCSVDFRQQMKL